MRTDRSAASAILLMVRHSAALLDRKRATAGGGPMLGRRSVSSNTSANRYQGMTLRQAALVAGFAYLLNPVSYAESSIYPKLVLGDRAFPMDSTLAPAPL